MSSMSNTIYLETKTTFLVTVKGTTAVTQLAELLEISDYNRLLNIRIEEYYDWWVIVVITPSWGLKTMMGGDGNYSISAFKPYSKVDAHSKALIIINIILILHSLSSQPPCSIDLWILSDEIINWPHIQYIQDMSQSNSERCMSSTGLDHPHAMQWSISFFLPACVIYPLSLLVFIRHDILHHALQLYSQLKI